jgi:site-specific DNA-adenine methylase
MNNSTRYPGGKGTCFQQIINLMPPHRVYIETHAGMGAVIRNKQLAELNIALELDEEVWMKLCKIVDNPYIRIYNLDALAYLRGVEPAEHTLIYSDPPYLPAARKSGRLYRCEYTEADHVALIQQLRSMWPTKIMISGYRSDLYENMLHDWNQYEFDTMTRGGPAIETLWFNYPWPTELHDYSNLGSDFRERERVQRKQKRWIGRLHRLPELERKAMLKLIKEAFGT